MTLINNQYLPPWLLLEDSTEVLGMHDRFVSRDHHMELGIGIASAWFLVVKLKLLDDVS